MGQNATRAQQAKARVREARLALLVERQAQDERIEDATVATVLAWEDLAGARSAVERAELLVGRALAKLGREKVPVRDMVALTGIDKVECARLLKVAAAAPLQEATAVTAVATLAGTSSGAQG